MYGALTETKSRISKKLLTSLPENVAEMVKHLADDYNIKSAKICTMAEGYKVYASEGDRVEVIYGERSQGVEFVSANTLGASGLCHDLNGSFVPPVGAWIVRVWYYDKYYMDIGNIVPQQIA